MRCARESAMRTVSKSFVTPLFVWICITGNACSGSPDGGGSTSVGGTGGFAGSGNIATGSTGNAGASSAPGGGGASGISVGGNTGSGVGACPVNIPASGDSCSGSIQCSWGDHPLVSCRTQATCSASRWTVIVPAAICGTPDTSCPATASNGQTCASDNFATCVYSDGTYCNCESCCTAVGCTPNCGSAGPHHVWSCIAPPQLLPNCPSVVPNKGSPCNLNSGTVCLDTCNLKVTCDSGIWHWNTQSCQQNNSGGVCASPDTQIATPTGERSIADIRVSDWVYSVDGNSVRAVRVARVIRRPVHNHHVIRVTTAEGQVLQISAPHPTADGRTFGDLRSSDLLDGQRLQSVEVIDYVHQYTYDILPDSDTGFYFASGMLIGSTIANGRAPMSKFKPLRELEMETQCRATERHGSQPNSQSMPATGM